MQHPILGGRQPLSSKGGGPMLHMDRYYRRTPRWSVAQQGCYGQKQSLCMLSP